MANLKGSNFEKQVRDANFRLAAFGEKRHGTNSHLTHSDGLRVKRDGYLNDFREYVEEQGLEGKLNELMTDELLADFLEQRLDGLAFSTQEDYLRGWSGMLQGLEQANISIPVGIDFFNTQVVTYKEDAIERGEVFNVPLQVISAFTPMEVIGQLPFASSCLAQLQYETGFRISEAYQVIENLELHLEDLKLKAVQGKGGQLYNEKIISLELKLMLLKLQRDQMQLPSYVTYSRQLQRFEMRSHDIRAYYAKELYETTLAELKQKEPNNPNIQTMALAIVSEAINHHRSEITLYYLDKFGGAG